jgi:uncharacterized membrane protein YjdF
MKADRNIFLLKIALVIVTLMIFQDQMSTREMLGLISVLGTIPLIFAIDVVEFFSKRKFSRALQISYLFFILMASIIGSNLMFYNHGFVYDKLAHIASGVLTVFMVRELFGRHISGQNAVVAFFFFVGIAALVAVAWESYEFSIDHFFGYDMQRIRTGTADTMVDMMTAVGGSIVGFTILRWSQRKAK